METEKKYYHFIFVLENIDITDDTIVDKIFEAGCDDASLGYREMIVFLDFDRKAESFQSAISSALEDINRIKIRVIRVEPGDAVTASEIAHRLDKSREYVRLLISGKRGKGNFPAPISGVDRPTQIFSWFEVIRWCYNNGIVDDFTEVENAEFILSMNQALKNHPFKNPQKTESAGPKARASHRQGHSNQLYPLTAESK